MSKENVNLDEIRAACDIIINTESTLTNEEKNFLQKCRDTSDPLIFLANNSENTIIFRILKKLEDINKILEKT